MLAHQLSIALENARLYGKVQEKEQLRGQLLERAGAAQRRLAPQVEAVLFRIART